MVGHPLWSPIGKHNVVDNSFTGQNYLQYPGWLGVETAHPEWNTLSASQWSPINGQMWAVRRTSS